MKVAILQSNYFPWLGYFELINYVDLFVIYDNVQFTKNDWRNRNRIQSSNGPIWLSVPCKTAGKLGQAINDVEVLNSNWPHKHMNAVANSYAHSPGVDALKEHVLPMFESFQGLTKLTEINELTLRAVCNLLNIQTNLIRLQELPSVSDKSERLAHICESFSAKTYVSGPAGLSYLNTDALSSRGIDLEIFDYSQTINKIVGYRQNPSNPFSIIHDIANGLVG